MSYMQTKVTCSGSRFYIIFQMPVSTGTSAEWFLVGKVKGARSAAVPYQDPHADATVEIVFRIIRISNRREAFCR